MEWIGPEVMWRAFDQLRYSCFGKTLLYYRQEATFVVMCFCFAFFIILHTKAMHLCSTVAAVFGARASCNVGATRLITCSGWLLKSSKCSVELVMHTKPLFLRNHCRGLSWENIAQEKNITRLGWNIGIAGARTLGVLSAAQISSPRPWRQRSKVFFSSRVSE